MSILTFKDTPNLKIGDKILCTEWPGRFFKKGVVYTVLEDGTVENEDGFLQRIENFVDLGKFELATPEVIQRYKFHNRLEESINE